MPPLRTYMDDASGVADGTAVRLNGIPIGYLDKLELTGSRDPKRTVEFDMKVKAEVSDADSGGFAGRHRRRQPAGR